MTTRTIKTPAQAPALVMLNGHVASFHRTLATARAAAVKVGGRALSHEVDGFGRAPGLAVGDAIKDSDGLAVHA